MDAAIFLSQLHLTTATNQPESAGFSRISLGFGKLSTEVISTASPSSPAIGAATELSIFLSFIFKLICKSVSMIFI